MELERMTKEQDVHIKQCFEKAESRVFITVIITEHSECAMQGNKKKPRERVQC